MKKVLLTSTAMVAFAGAAAAEVTISGWAEMGFVGGDGIVTQFFQDVDIDFTLSGETDGGLTFGANVDLDEAGNLGDSFGNQGVDIFVSGEFGTVTLGDTDGALDWAVAGPDAWGNPGSIDDSETAHWGRQDTYLDGSYDGQILRYDYTYEDFGFAVSVEQDDRSDIELDAADEDRYDYNWAVGAKWSPELGSGTLKLGIGYQEADFGEVGFGLTDAQVDALAEDIFDALGDTDLTALTPEAAGALNELGNVFGFRPQNTGSDELTVALGENNKVWAISAGYEMDNGFSFGGVYSDWDSKALKSGSYWGIGAGYSWEAFSIHANYGEHDFEYNGGSSLKTKGYGIAAGYDLGGGLSVLAGYGKSEADIGLNGTVDTGSYDADGVFTPDGGTADIDESFDTTFDTFSLGLAMSF